MSSGYSSSASPSGPGAGEPSGTGQDGAEIKDEWNMDEEDWDPSLPKPRPGEVVTKRTLQNREHFSRFEFGPSLTSTNTLQARHRESFEREERLE